MWQRARYIGGDDDDADMVGQLVWLRVGPPERYTGLAFNSDDSPRVPRGPEYESNVQRVMRSGPYAGQIAVRCFDADAVELLAEFAEHVEPEIVE